MQQQDRTLFVANVPPDTTSKDLSQLFSGFGEVEDVHFGHDGGASAAPMNSPPAEDEEMATDESNSDSGMEVDGPARRKKRKLSQKQAPKVTPLPTPDLRTLRTTGQTAHVVFTSPSALDASLAPLESPLKWPKSRNPPTGLAHYLAKYEGLRPPLDAVKRHADESLEAYEFIRVRRERARMGVDESDEDEDGGEKKRKPGPVVDEDGFTLVTRGGPKRGPKVVTKNFAAAIQHGEQNEAAERLQKHQEKIHHKDFYRFQVREKKRSAFMEQRKKFEQDKEAIERLKAKRKFKPY